MSPRLLLLVAALGACTGGEDTDTPASPTLSILTPADDATVTAGDVEVSVIVDGFTLVSPAATARTPTDPLRWLPFATAWAHGDGEPSEGWVQLHLDGADVAQLDVTQTTLTGVAIGAHTLKAELIHEDGDPLDPAVTASVSFTAQ